MSLAVTVALVLFLGITLYAVFGGADFGTGVWDLLAGGAERGARPRALVDLAIGAVWEANHVWLIFCLVVLWTAFSETFAAIMTTLFVPLLLAAFGIVLRGAGFAFRKSTTTFRERQAYGTVFAASSIVTPFFMGAVAGSIASGRVEVGEVGDAFDSWLNPTSILGGVLAVATCAFLAASFLVFDATRHGDDDLARYFARRGIAAGFVTGVIAVVGVFVLHADAPYLFDQLTHRALPLMIVSGICGVGTMVVLALGRSLWARVLSVGAVVAVVWGWGVAQYDYMLPETLTIEEAAAPPATLWSVIGVVIAAVFIVVPALFLLYRLSQTSMLESEGLAEVASENIAPPTDAS